MCPPKDHNRDDCQADSTGTKRQLYCPSGSQGTPPNCTSVATGQPAPGRCPNVTAQEWDLGQAAIALSQGSGGLEQGFGINQNKSVFVALGPLWVHTNRSIGPASGEWPAGLSIFVHAHPSGGGISQGDVQLTQKVSFRIVSAGVGTDRYGTAQQGTTPVTCEMPQRP